MAREHTPTPQGRTRRYPNRSLHPNSCWINQFHAVGGHRSQTFVDGITLAHSLLPCVFVGPQVVPLSPSGFLTGALKAAYADSIGRCTPLWELMPLDPDVHLSNLIQPPIRERRAHPRHRLENRVPVLFGHSSARHPTAGFIADVGAGGARIEAPPTARPQLHWGDSFQLIVSYSETIRAAGFEQLELDANVVRIVADRKQYTLHAAFASSESNDDWSRLRHWLHTLTEPPNIV